MINNNTLEIEGTVVSDFVYSHEVFGEGFYTFFVEIERTSGKKDRIPVMISERMVDVKTNMVGTGIHINGQFRSFNKRVGEKNRLILSVFARKIQILEDDPVPKNTISFRGIICKDPKYRETPLGREITDLLLAVNRPYGKSDYIPCICWGRNARFAGNMSVGDKIEVFGRIQSREYTKKLSDTESETRIAYEISVSRLEVIYSGEEN